MKVSGEHLVAVGRQQLWDALHDPEVLRSALPGCSQLDRAVPGRYAVTIRVGIPCVEGAYHGDLQELEHMVPSSLTLAASAAGEKGNGRGQVKVDLDETDGGTRVRYDVDVEVAGAISRVGHRLLASAVDRTIADHLDAVARGCDGGAGDPSAAGVRSPSSTSPAPSPGASPAVAAGQGAPEDRHSFAPFALTRQRAALVAAIACVLVGFLLGRWSRR